MKSGASASSHSDRLDRPAFAESTLSSERGRRDGTSNPLKLTSMLLLALSSPKLGFNFLGPSPSIRPARTLHSGNRGASAVQMNSMLTSDRLKTCMNDLLYPAMQASNISIEADSPQWPPRMPAEQLLACFRQISAAATRSENMQEENLQQQSQTERAEASVVSPGKLIILRHGESAWNAENRFTGWEDTPLTMAGVKEAMNAANVLHDYAPVYNSSLSIDVCYTSLLSRSIQTGLWALLRYITIPWSTGPPPVPSFRTTWRLNERHYGALQGVPKSAAKEKLPKAELQTWRNTFEGKPPPMWESHPYHSRSAERVEALQKVEAWSNTPESQRLRLEDVPLSESLADCTNRVGPLWEDELKPQIMEGKNVLVVAHANCLRSLISQIQGNVDDDQLQSLDVPNAVPIIYEFEDDGSVKGNEDSCRIAPIEGSYLGQECQVFNELDHNGDGIVDIADLANEMTCPVIWDDQVPVAECGQKMLDEADINHDGVVSFKEFCSYTRLDRINYNPLFLQKATDPSQVSGTADLPSQEVAMQQDVEDTEDDEDTEDIEFRKVDEIQQSEFRKVMRDIEFRIVMDRMKAAISKRLGAKRDSEDAAEMTLL